MAQLTGSLPTPTDGSTLCAEREEVHLTNMIVPANPNPKQESLMDEVEATTEEIFSCLRENATDTRVYLNRSTGNVATEATITTLMYECD